MTGGKADTAFDTTAFREALGQFATGVAVITTLGPQDRPIGVTINAFSALSLDPPMILFCLGKDAATFDFFNNTKHFAVNLLTASQAALSNRFARSMVADWRGISVTEGRFGLPLIPACLANLECTREDRLDGGDHVIFIGRVVGLVCRDGDPLVFFASRYRGLSTLAES